MMPGTLNATLAMLAPRMRTLIATVAVATAIATAMPAQAQFGGRAGFAEAFVPDILQRDLPLMTSSLQLEEWQRPVAEALLQDYVTGFNTGVEALKDRMKSESQDAQRADPTNADAILDKVMKPMNSWREEKRRMLDKFMADLKSQLGPQQLERWPNFERALRRERMLHDGDLSGESTDLFALMGRMQLDPVHEEMVKPAIAVYEVALDDALVARDRGMRAIEPELADAMRSMNHDKGADAQDRIMSLRIAVRSANDAGIDSIARALADRGEEFRTLALAAGYPDVFRPHPVTILMQQARALDSLTPEQGPQIDALMAEFAGVCHEQNMQLYEAVRAEEPKAPRKRAEASAQRRAGGATPAVPQASNASDPVVKARVERERTGEPFRERLMAILTPEQRAELPGGIKVDPANQPGNKDGEPSPKRMQIDSVQSAADTDGIASDRHSKRRDPRSAMGATKGAGTKEKEQPAPPEGTDSKAQPAPAPTTPE
jgi:hypothetical protein